RQDSPHPHTPPNYGAKVQYAKESDTSLPLDKDGQRFIQQLAGTFLFPSARGRQPTPGLAKLHRLATIQANPVHQIHRQAAP
ncbi:hypothetical protein THAOC_24657, partial [Thalassiosira oceanica]